MAKPTPAPKKIPVKGKPMGIPVWGWVIAAVIGIVVGYTILKKSGGASGGSSAEGSSDALGMPQEDESSPGGGNIAIPIEDILKALGLRGGSNVQSSPTTEQPFVQESFETLSRQESTSDPVVQQLVSSDPIVQQLAVQGITTAPEGTTVEFQGTTYDVSGTPEFSPGNYNPNSPQGVLAMNQANEALNLWAPTVAMPGSIPNPMPDYSTDITVRPSIGRHVAA